MAFTAPVKSTNFELTPAGSHVGRLVWLLDLGTTHNELYDKEQRQMFMGFELPNLLMKPDDNGIQRPFMIGQFFTRSMSDKANLRKFLESWRGQGFTDDEAGQFDISLVVDKTAFVSVIHKQKQNSNDMKAVISSVIKLPKEMNCPPAVNEILILDLDKFDRAVFDKLSENMQGQIQKSNEWRVISGAVKQTAPNPLASNPNPDDFSDDIPF